MAVAAKELKNSWKEYVELAGQFAERIIALDKSDWSLRYFAGRVEHL